MNQKIERNRVLTPQEFDLIYNIIPKEKFKRSFNNALYTGMRPRELYLFSQNPKWHDPKRRTVFLPMKYTKTKKERYVHLTRHYNEILSLYLENGGELYYPKKTRSWYDNVRRWAEQAGIEDWWNINAKTTRKTWESWLVVSGYDGTKILLSQGHIQSTALAHYLNLRFTDDEVREIKVRTAGWME